MDRLFANLAGIGEGEALAEAPPIENGDPSKLSEHDNSHLTEPTRTDITAQAL